MKLNNPYSSNKKLYLQSIKKFIYYKYGELDLRERKCKEERGITHEKGDRKNNIYNCNTNNDISIGNANNTDVSNRSISDK